MEIAQLCKSIQLKNAPDENSKNSEIRDSWGKKV